MKSLALILLIYASPIVVPAQNRAGFPWWNSPVRNDIGLSEEQNQKLRSIVHEYRNRLLDARNNVLKAQGDLEDIMNGPQVDPNQAKAVIDHLTSAQAASSRVFLEMSI